MTVCQRHTAKGQKGHINFSFMDFLWRKKWRMEKAKIICTPASEINHMHASALYLLPGISWSVAILAAELFLSRFTWPTISSLLPTWWGYLPSSSSQVRQVLTGSSVPDLEAALETAACLQIFVSHRISTAYTTSKHKTNTFRLSLIFDPLIFF